MEKTINKKFITVPSRQVPITTDCDVMVCGGGPAGSAAALSAARNGAKVVLVESTECLGGIITSGLLSWLIDCDKGGIVKELVDAMKKKTNISRTGNLFTAYSHPEIMKSILEEKCVEAGVEIKLHTSVSGVITKKNKINYVLTESKGGAQAHHARTYIDCTGDGDLSALAGCGFDIGRDPDGAIQPMSMIAFLTGITFEDVYEFTAHVGSESPYNRLLNEMQRAKLSPSYSRPTLYHLGNNIFTLVANHQYCFSPVDSGVITKAVLEARKEINAQINGLRSLGGVWSNIQLLATSSNIGIREGRRIHGRYRVTLGDLINGKQHEDAICDVKFGIDIHSVDGSKDKGICNGNFKTRMYQIPLRALQSRDVENLMMAGRCISGDFYAHSSYRVCGNAITMGEAAGRFAALNNTDSPKNTTQLQEESKIINKID